MRNFTQQPIGTLSTDTPERAERYTRLSRFEAQARIIEARHAAAERAAIQRRQDIDRIILAAIDSLEVEGIEHNIDDTTCLPPRAGMAYYVAGAANIPLAERAPFHPDRVTYILELLADIRTGLSPVVTGRIA